MEAAQSSVFQQCHRGGENRTHTCVLVAAFALLAHCVLSDAFRTHMPSSASVQEERMSPESQEGGAGGDFNGSRRGTNSSMGWPSSPDATANLTSGSLDNRPFDEDAQAGDAVVDDGGRSFSRSDAESLSADTTVLSSAASAYTADVPSVKGLHPAGPDATDVFVTPDPIQEYIRSPSGPHVSVNKTVAVSGVSMSTASEKGALQVPPRPTDSPLPFASAEQKREMSTTPATNKEPDTQVALNSGTVADSSRNEKGASEFLVRVSSGVDSGPLSSQIHLHGGLSDQKRLKDESWTGKQLPEALSTSEANATPSEGPGARVETQHGSTRTENTDSQATRDEPYYLPPSVSGETRHYVKLWAILADFAAMALLIASIPIVLSLARGRGWKFWKEEDMAFEGTRQGSRDTAIGIPGFDDISPGTNRRGCYGRERSRYFPV
ncbi:putative transmembrane protein [Toxoplasma gondii TgCatPRC2]|uniref:Putative transmembrane protein n=1 Tax=Toxoplasma gondii TgCatPRC2 TaxID=1130821 RepID=A0A151H0D8_TOXGO|nr:putative transmembrane protein [Toxoplasma gondii TgCatPRC2]